MNKKIEEKKIVKTDKVKASEKVSTFKKKKGKKNN